MANGNFDPYSLPNYAQIEREFQSLYGADKDFRKYLSDPAYRKSLISPVEGLAEKFLGHMGGQTPGQRFFARDDVQNLLSTMVGIESQEPINLDPQFAQLRGEVGELSKQSLQTQRQNIGRAAEGAQERATEGLAGTGLGRSGVAAEQFGSIETRRQDLLAGAEAQVEQKRLETLFNLSLQQANMEYSEQLRIAGFSQDMIKDALAFDRLLMQMQFAQELQGEEDSSFFEDLVNIGGSIVKGAAGLGWQPLA